MLQVRVLAELGLFCQAVREAVLLTQGEEEPHKTGVVSLSHTHTHTLTHTITQTHTHTHCHTMLYDMMSLPPCDSQPIKTFNTNKTLLNPANLQVDMVTTY